ncbi:MAG: hypothetical protein P8J87_18515, partial [Verrucomicrobiales bacterium]|nr:hypothetical protein [Verrucomicrobiales bacterium]
MDFFAAALLLILYFIRPQDWVPGMAGLNIVKPIIALGLLGLMSRSRTRDPEASSGGESLTPRMGLSPHDWMMLIYITYIVVTAPDSFETLKGILPLGSFYLLTALALNTSDRLLRYLKYWAISVTAIAALAVASEFGIDITQSADLTERMQGRLVLNTWMLNNPNALGHTAIAAVPLAYFIFGWKRP